MWIEFPGQRTVSRDWLEAHPQEAQELLTQCKGRYPLCKCREPGLPLYIAQRQRLYLARLPNTGPQHAPQCPSYEPEAALCGFGLYSKQAMRESADGQLTIKLATPLLLRPSASMQRSMSDTRRLNEPTAVRDALGLTGLLHLLWERSGFNRWQPGMRDRRRYRQWRKFLLESAQGIYLKRQALTSHVYIPEPYVPTRALQIEAQRQRSFAQLSKTSGGRPVRILGLGKVRSIVDRPTGTGLRLAHLANEFVIGLPTAALSHLRTVTAFAWLDAYTIHPQFQIFVLMTLLRSHDCSWRADAIAGLVTAAEFIPLFSIEDALVSRRLIDEGRSFYKPLPYDGGAAQVPSFILTDTGASSVPMEVVPDDPAVAVLRRSRIDEYQATQRRFWVWEVSDSAIPPALQTAQ